MYFAHLMTNSITQQYEINGAPLTDSYCVWEYRWAQDYSVNHCLIMLEQYVWCWQLTTQVRSSTNKIYCLIYFFDIDIL